MAKLIFIMAALVNVALAQRPGYAGSMPYGYPVMVTSTTTTTAPPTGATDSLGNRFGSVPTPTTQRLPLEANGNAELVNELMKLPIDHQPFWLINWQALEDHRNRPQTYQIHDNEFLDFGSSVGASDRSGGDGYLNK